MGSLCLDDPKSEYKRITINCMQFALIILNKNPHQTELKGNTNDNDNK